MKNQVKFLILAILTGIAAACSSGGVKTEAMEAQQLKNSSYDQAYYANTTESNIEWQGYKPTGTHHGNISISNGILETKDGKLVGGEFTIDMNSIVVVDLTDADKNAKLLGHLKSADFFDATTYPGSKFEITSIKVIDGSQIDKTKEKGDIAPTHAITGNLTMKGISKSITFNAKVSMDKNSIVASTNQFFIDRSQWNVQYGSRSFFNDLKDNFINDEIGLSINLVAIKSEEITKK